VPAAGASDTEANSGSESEGQPFTFADPSYRIGQLRAANQRVVSAKPDNTITQAVTLMLSNNISQMPVMTNERDVKGMITWQTIGSKITVGTADHYTREFTEPHHEVRLNSSLFHAIPIITTNDYVLVRGMDGKISGIVTSSDLSSEFRKLTEPFLLLSEIELSR
jgi:predicted transcriptional regulator